MIINALIESKAELAPARVYCLGSDYDPVTPKEIREAQDYIREHGSLPKSWPKKYKYYTVERGPLPGVLLVELGSHNRPAHSLDIIDMQKLLRNNACDPELTIVTHHNFHMKWIEKGKH